MASIFDSSHQDDVDRKIAVGLERISGALKALIWLESKSSGLSPIQIQFLTSLQYEKSNDWTINALASRYVLAPATVSDAVSSLAVKGLVRRVRPAADRRIVIVTLTEKGKNRALRLSGWANLLQTKVNALSSEEKRTLLASLITLLQGLEESGVVTNFHACPSCAYFRPSTEPTVSDSCSYLTQSLDASDYRVDCPHHNSQI